MPTLPTNEERQEAVLAYMKRKMAPIPIPPKSKNPNRKNWAEESWGPEDVSRLWGNGQNVGILNGEPSGWAVSVDCDCLEALRLAPKFLPPTLKGGRESTPGSHWWYRSPRCESLFLTDVDGKRIIELRSNGCQTVVYPSQHPSGEQYLWYKDQSARMERIGADELTHRVRLLHTSALIARHMPPIGARHDYALALAGFLLRNGRLTEAEASHVMVSAWSLFEDATREAIRDVGSTVRTTAERLERKLPVRGGGALAVYEEGLPKAISNGWDWRIGRDEDPSYSWPAPEELPEGLPPVPVFDLRLLPESFRPLVKDVAERMQVPMDFVAIPLMVALSAVVGRKVGMRPKRRDDWTVVPNLWGAIVGRPGLLKSPALKGALSPLAKLVADATSRHERQMQEYTVELELHQAEVAAYEAKKKALAKEGDLSKVRQYVEHNRPGEPPDEPRVKRYRTSDTTVEKLGELLNQNPNGLMLFRDELVGWLKGLDRYGREGDRAFYLESWSGDQGHDVDRIGRGSLHVPALTLSILGGIQPGPLSTYVYQSGSDNADDDGLLPRFQMLVWPDASPEFKNVDEWPDRQARGQAFGVFDFCDTLNYKIPSDADDPHAIPAIRFTEEAQQVFDTWRESLELEVRSGELSPALESLKAKHRSLMPSLALLLELADSADVQEVKLPDGEILRQAMGRPPEDVSEGSAIKAVAWCEYLEAHARRVYYSAERPETKSAKELLKHIKRGDIDHGEQVRSLYRKGWSNLRDRGEVEGALEILEEHGWLRVVKIDTGGRPTENVLLHPELRGR